LRSAERCSKRLTAHSSRVREQFPVTHVDPAAELITDLFKVSDLFESKFFVEFDARIVGKRYSGDDRVREGFGEFFK